MKKKLGADVPFSLKNVPAHVEGIGEKVTPIKLKKQYHVVVIKPKQGLSTKTVFEESDKHELKHGNVNDVIKAHSKENITMQVGFNELAEEEPSNDVQITLYDMNLIYNHSN